MRFLVDECTGPVVARWLRAQGHDVYSVYEQARGASDDTILAQAYVEQRVLISNDKDFGERVFRERRPHRGVIFMRLENERTQVKIRVLRQLIERYGERLVDHFVVVTETQVRFASNGRQAD